MKRNWDLDGAGCSVFLIDDDGYVSHLYEEALVRVGCYVELCCSVSNALEIANTGKAFDVIVLDLMLPWGPYSEADSEGGLRTGALLYRDLSREYPDALFMVLTNYSRTQVPAELVDESLTICKKSEYKPRKFASLLIEKIRSRR